MTRILINVVMTILILVCMLQIPLIVALCPDDCKCIERNHYDPFDVTCKSVVILEDQLKSLKHQQKIQLSIYLTTKIEKNAFEGFDNIEYLSIFARKLDFLHEKVFEKMIQLKHLILRYTSIQTINLNMFANLQSLTSLAITNNYKLRFDMNASFPHLPRLESLDLSYDPQLNVNKDLLRHLENIKVLTLNKISINELKEGYFDQLTKLEELYLSSNKIENIDEKSFQDLQSLRNLDLSFNLLRSINGSLFSMLTKLENLDLSNNMIKIIDHNMLHNAKLLKEFSLKKNKVTTIYSDMFHFSRGLEFILFSWNNIKHIPINMFQNLKKLRGLTLDHNEISSISPRMFWGLNVLQILNLGHNRISFSNSSKKEDNKGKDIKRTNIDTSNNKLVKCTGHVSKINNTSNGNLSINICKNGTIMDDLEMELNVEHSHFFFGLVELRRLDLSNNFISFLPIDVFYGLENLRRLHLDSNKIRSLQGILSHLPNLHSFYACNNSITVLSEKLFFGQTRLTTLCISYNQISTVHHNVFSPMKNSMFLLDLRGNDLPCSCYTINLLPQDVRHLSFDCILKGKRVNIQELSCDRLTRELQKIVLTFDDRLSSVTYSEYKRPGKEFMIKFILRKIMLDGVQQEVFLNFRSKHSIIINRDNVRILATNASLYTSINQNVIHHKFTENLYGDVEQIQVKVIYEKELSNSRLTIFINDRVADSLKTILENEYDEIAISSYNIYVEKDKQYDAKYFTSRCVYVNHSCISSSSILLNNASLNDFKTSIATLLPTSRCVFVSQLCTSTVGVDSTNCKCDDFEKVLLDTGSSKNSQTSIGKTLPSSAFVLVVALLVAWIASIVMP